MRTLTTHHSQFSAQPLAGRKNKNNPCNRTLFPYRREVKFFSPWASRVLGEATVVVGDLGKVGLAGGENGVPGKGTNQQEVMTMVRRRFSIAGLLAVGVMMIATDASQAQLLQRLRDRMGRGSSDEGSSRRFSLRRSYYRGEQTVVENGVPITNGTPITNGAPISSSQVALEIRVPRSAEVFVAGEKISGTGTMRTFTSDNLTSGQTY